MKRVAPRADLDKHTILDVLSRALPHDGVVLELASGTGQHIAHFSAALPNLEWQPTEIGPVSLQSIEAWCAGHRNVRPPVELDVERDWPITAVDAIVAINLLHVIPWAATGRVLQAAARVLPAGAPFVIYGPFRTTDDEPMDPRPQLAGWTVPIHLPQLAMLEAAAAAQGFAVADVIVMPEPAYRAVLLRKR